MRRASSPMESRGRFGFKALYAHSFSSFRSSSRHCGDGSDHCPRRLRWWIRRQQHTAPANCLAHTAESDRANGTQPA